MADRIDDGFSTRMLFYDDLTAADLDTGNVASKFTFFWEKEVTPPGYQGGGANDTSTMLNSSYRTMAPKKLITLSEASFVAAYDPEVIDQIIAQLNKNLFIRCIFPDGSGWDFWGWLDEFTPNASVEGEQPTAECKVIPSNQDDAGDETAPDYVPVVPVA